MSPSTPPRSTISAFVICANEEIQIRRCLESVKWCDEIVVVDSGSKDSTLSIVREYTDKIHHREWTGYVAQKRFALEHCHSEWVFNLDADEEVSFELKDEILELLQKDLKEQGAGKKNNGFLVSRVVFFLNRWWRKGGWYPEYRLRMCRRSVTSWGGIDPHEKAIVSGTTTKLKGELHHYTYSSITDQVRRINTLSSNAAFTMLANNRSASILEIIFRPLIRVFKFYIIKRGYREGFAGFLVAWLEGLQVFLKYVKAWEGKYWDGVHSDGE